IEKRFGLRRAPNRLFVFRGQLPNMRRRKRPEYRVRVYKYWARPLGEIPEAFWQLAHKMREAWNALAEARAKTAEGASSLPKDEQKRAWAAHRDMCRRIVV